MNGYSMLTDETFIYMSVLNLEFTGLDSFDFNDMIFWPNLIELDLSRNTIKAFSSLIPSNDTYRLSKLQLHDCSLTSPPNLEVLCQSLEELDLSDNNIRYVPRS